MYHHTNFIIIHKWRHKNYQLCQLTQVQRSNPWHHNGITIIATKTTKFPTNDVTIYRDTNIATKTTKFPTNDVTHEKKTIACKNPVLTHFRFLWHQIYFPEFHKKKRSCFFIRRDQTKKCWFVSKSLKYTIEASNHRWMLC